MPARIGLIGAPGTGKSTLSRELAEHLRTRGRRVFVRASGPPQDAPFAQDEAIDADLVIEDAPPVQSLADCALILLMGLDLTASPLAGAERPAREAADARLRQALQDSGIGWRVIYGQGPQRVQQALEAVAAVLPWAWTVTAREEDIGRWSRLRASCETCGDAACEHRLFTGGALRPTAPPT